MPENKAISDEVIETIEEAVRKAVFDGHRIGEIKDPIESAFWQAYHAASEEKAKARAEEEPAADASSG